MKVSPTHEDWRNIIYCGVENQQIDFKSAQDWEELSRAGRAKFARHAMALANTQGGYVVVGVGEDDSGKPNLYTGMTAKQASSFDPSTVGQTVNRYADPAVDFDIVRPVVDGKTYVVFVVYPFRDLPHVCGDACENELQRGVFYIRTPEARSRAAYRASELHLLVQRSLRNQRESLGRLLRGILYEDRQGAEATPERLYDGYAQRARRYAEEALGGAASLRARPVFEVLVTPQRPLSDVTLTELRHATARLERPALKDCLWPGTSHQAECFAGNDSLRAGQRDQQGHVLSCWEFFQDGLFYGAAPLSETAEGAIAAEDVLQLSFVAIAFAAQLFAQLNRQTELLTLTLRLRNTQQRLMNACTQQSPAPCICLIPDVEVRKQRSVGDLVAGGDAAVAAKMFLEICERFNAPFGEKGLSRMQEELVDYLRRGLLKG